MTPTRNHYLQDIFIYPIKSLGGIAVNEILIEERGLKYDRRWMLIDKNNQFLTQRKLAEMALVEVSLKEDVLVLKHKGKLLSVLKIPVNSLHFQIQNVLIWHDQVSAPVIEDREIQEWFLKAIGEEVKLVKMDKNSFRPVDPAYALHNEEVSFADGFPFLITNQASLDDLNNRLDIPVPMIRFRPNLVVSGAQPFEEDHWDEIEIGTAIFKVVKPCGRCVVTTINHSTAEKGPEPLKTLSSYRTFKNKIIFGQNMVLKSPGVISKGDKILITYR